MRMSYGIDGGGGWIVYITTTMSIYLQDLGVQGQLASIIGLGARRYLPLCNSVAYPASRLDLPIGIRSETRDPNDHARRCRCCRAQATGGLIYVSSLIFTSPMG